MPLTQANALRHDKTNRHIVTSSRWLLLRNAPFLQPEGRVALKEFLQANRPLTVVYLMRDELKALWHYRYVASAAKLWHQWYHRAVRFRIDPLKRFARRLKPYIAGILAHCRYPLGTNLIEGITTRSRSSSAWPSASETTTTSSSRSGQPSPEMGEEPKKSGPQPAFFLQRSSGRLVKRHVRHPSANQHQVNSQQFN